MGPIYLMSDFCAAEYIETDEGSILEATRRSHLDARRVKVDRALTRACRQMIYKRDGEWFRYEKSTRLKICARWISGLI